MQAAWYPFKVSKGLFVLVSLFLVAALLSGCGGDSGTSGSQRSARFVVGLHHAQALDTVLEASLLVDGIEINRFSSDTGTEPVGLQGTLGNIQPGRHRIEVVIVRQTSSPNSYLFNGSVFFEDRQIFLDPTQGTLATGESLSTFFDL